MWVRWKAPYEVTSFSKHFIAMGCNNRTSEHNNRANGNHNQIRCAGMPSCGGGELSGVSMTMTSNHSGILKWIT